MTITALDVALYATVPASLGAEAQEAASHARARYWLATDGVRKFYTQVGPNDPYSRSMGVLFAAIVDPE